jgi:DUF4097 and DUF4098 domain-containing protein YvlB
MRLWTFIATLAFAGPVLAAPADVNQVNGSIAIDAGQQAGKVSTVNGAIRLGDRASAGEVHTVNGDITLGNAVTAAALGSVNGTITLGDEAAAGSATTTNGAIHLGSHGRIAGAATTVNGAVTLGSAADVSGRVRTVNGAVQLRAAHVGGGIETVSHDIDIGANSRVEGGILVRKRDESWLETWLRQLFSEHDPLPRIVIGPGAVVTGTLRFERAVKLYVSDRARIGAVEGATAIAFSGEQPPA